jgi:DNA transformation protein and related proteins
MATKESTAEYIMEQLADAGRMRLKKMFGEYAIYCDDKVVAFICDDQLFVKPTDEGRAFIGDPEEAPAYPGSKMYFLIDRLEDREWLTELIHITAAAVPVKKKAKKKKK